MAISRLFIAEKPSVGKAVAARLGQLKSHGTHIECKNGDVVTWCFGHLYEQANPDYYNEEWKTWKLEHLPMVPKVWKLLPKKEAKAQIAAIKKLLAETKTVVNLGDCDAEGELLVSEVLEDMKWKGPTLRLWLAAMNDDSIDKALKSMKDAKETYPLKLSAEARSRADWLIGMNLTRAYTIAGRNNGGDGVLSVGRVQTPTLALVVRRDDEIDNFKAKNYFEVFGDFKTASATVKAKWLSPKEGVGIDAEERVVDRNLADAVVAKVKGQPAQVSLFESKKGAQGAPLPFSLSALQATASAKFGLSAQKVLDIAQSLYETHKLTSYPRTDCQYLPESMHADAKDVLAALAATYPALASLIGKANAKVKSGAFNDKKVTAHHGIIPTNARASISRLSADEAKVYDLICRHFVAQFYPNHEFLQNTVEFTVAAERFRASGRQVVKPGWKEVFGAGLADEEDEGEDKQAIPVLNKGDKAHCLTCAVVAKETKPPSRFTEGTLIKAMANIAAYVTDPAIKKLLKESAGIGTEATRAGILETLKTRGFVTAKGKQLISTPKGRALVRALPDVLTFPDLTAVFEQRLGEIRTKEVSPEEFMAKQVGFVTKLVGDARGASVAIEPAHKCPDCGSALRRIKKKDNSYFWGCSAFSTKGCRFGCSDLKGKPDLGGKGKAAPAKPTVKRKAT
jgi:DNA topoisomerase III